MFLLSRVTVLIMALFYVAIFTAPVYAQAPVSSALPLRPPAKAPARAAPAEGHALAAAANAHLAASPKRKSSAAFMRGDSAFDARSAAPAPTKSSSTGAPPPPPVRTTPKRTGVPLRQGSLGGSRY